MLEIAYADWLSLGFRWLHVIADIGIGTSFYFIFLDSACVPPVPPQGVGGEAWNVWRRLLREIHRCSGGDAEGTALVQVRGLALPGSGFALPAVIYYWGAESYLIDKEVLDLQSWEAIRISAGLAGGRIVYDLLRRMFSSHELLLSAAVFVLIAFSRA